MWDKHFVPFSTLRVALRAVLDASREGKSKFGAVEFS
jgi:hypothetical protein